MRPDIGDEPAPAEAEVMPDERTRELSMIELLNLVLRHRRLVLGLPAVFALLAILLWLGRGSEYAAESAFLPQEPTNRLAGISGVAAELGVNLGGALGGDAGLGLYADIVETYAVLRGAVLTAYVRTTEDGDSTRATLLEIYQPERETAAQRERRAVDELRRNVEAGTDFDAGLVRVTTTAESSELAVQINRRLLELVAVFNLETRQSQASAERQFVEMRMEEARQELSAAEQDLGEFLETNRQWANSPQLEFEHDRLQRRVDLRLRVYTSLAEAYEEARVEEVRNTPVITIVDGPEGNTHSARRSIVVLVFAAVMLGLAIAVTTALLIEQFRVQRERHPRAYAEFRRLRDGFAGALPGHCDRPRAE